MILRVLDLADSAAVFGMFDWISFSYGAFLFVRKLVRSSFLRSEEIH